MVQIGHLLPCKNTIFKQQISFSLISTWTQKYTHIALAKYHYMQIVPLSTGLAFSY